MTDDMLMKLAEQKVKAFASFILGLLSIIAWLIPFLGLPVTIFGLLLGSAGMKSSNRGLALTGLILCAIFLLATLASAIISAYLITNSWNGWTVIR